MLCCILFGVWSTALAAKVKVKAGLVQPFIFKNQLSSRTLTINNSDSSDDLTKQPNMKSAARATRPKASKEKEHLVAQAEG